MYRADYALFVVVGIWGLPPQPSLKPIKPILYLPHREKKDK
jgi:hypothetical protein